MLHGAIAGSWSIEGHAGTANLAKAASYLKGVYNVATTTQAKINKLLEEQAAVFNDLVEQ